MRLLNRKFFKHSLVQSEHKRQVRSMRAVRCKEDLGLLVKTAASGAHDAQRGAAHTQCVVTDTAQHIPAAGSSKQAQQCDQVDVVEGGFLAPILLSSTICQQTARETNAFWRPRAERRGQESCSSTLGNRSDC
eukprot:1143858-Pelagomonas_calceolata.AAC.5